MWQRRNPGLLNVTLGRTAGGNEMKGDGGGYKDRLISVFVKMEGSRLASDPQQDGEAIQREAILCTVSLTHMLTLCRVTLQKGWRCMDI